jgi:hypothetical protein
MLPIMDILEDALKDKFPMLISAVRVEEIDLGLTPFKVRKMVRMDPTVPLADNHKPEEDNSRQVNMEVEFSYDGSDRKQASVGLLSHLKPTTPDDESLLCKPSSGQHSHDHLDCYRDTRNQQHRITCLRRAFGSFRVCENPYGADL